MVPDNAESRIRTLDTRVYHLTKKVARIESGLSNMTSEVRSLKRFLMLIIVTGIIGPVSSVLLSHLWPIIVH